MSDFKLLINGKLVDGARTSNVVNPATEEPVAACPRASEAQLNEAVAAAKAAFPAWSATPIDERKKALNAIADVIEANGAELARLLTQEQGKPIGDATGEVYGTAAFFRYFTMLDLPVKIIEDSEGKKVEAHRRPLGVIGAIVPWNFPMILMAFKLPPALLAGNTVVLKPAPTTPLTSLKLGELIKDILPAGVVNIVADENDLGAALTAHPDVRKISFTGSTATGQKVMAGAAGLLKRITLELGGNDAGIVLGDVNPKEAAPKLFQSAFQNSGQVCIAMKRLYVHESIYDEMCNELAELANNAVIGDGLKQGTQLGPLQNKMQFDKVKELIEDARKTGKIIAGGDTPEEKGYFIRPTIVRDITDGSRLVDEEQFGPVLPVIKYSDADDAVARANASPYGLGGSIWSNDKDKAYELATKMESGSVWINKHADLAPNIPFGGARFSGLGTELGEEGLAEFTQLKIINMAK
ncbi:aldehyde dehydrogenase family protein [Parvibaculum sp.]|jgi:acyl-CoA reductase-like NAD-dependent aldehyde dehydrogenase|uniref:aldehyde dehydrogenase family protein n=1 Tax=Parvibaculum sp. TaxID=2024848 RepID=UPI001B2560FC|nr:aldehyde dehydrogenase family protein [Parvibaculum sp.]MBO6677695.1 aldehyde dehydrogenase family protein [Parvibaculum sp.]MBO6685383.1 aldehyde dehydrogenase family protein [Parvibaculum sp.]MBO6905456.1 aldehyde dehydrogenase family protein [Parvibaculum sp.]